MFSVFLNSWDMMKMTAVCGLFSGIWYLSRRSSRHRKLSTWHSAEEEQPTLVINEDFEDESSDPGLLKKHSEFRAFSTSKFNYPALRIFYRRHPQADKLPQPPLPLFVFIHGLGGSIAQFHPLLTSLANLSSCLAIDLPGCGLSDFSPRAWDAYTTDALVELLSRIIEEYRDKNAQQQVVLVGHSMGGSLAAMLASSASASSRVLAEHVVGLVAICPRANPPTEDEVQKFRKLLLIPGPIFDLWRRWDRRGGTESASVIRFVGADSDLELRKMQLRFNDQSRTPVWRRMAFGLLPTYTSGVACGGLPGKDIWEGLNVPVFLIAGEMDNVTSPNELATIAGYLGKSRVKQSAVQSEPLVESAAPVDLPESLSASDKQDAESKGARFRASVVTSGDLGSTHTESSPLEDEELSRYPRTERPGPIVKTTILPAPANHTLLYMPSTVRTLAGLISDFLCSEISSRLSLGWQLQFLSGAGKWDVKNLAKWQAVAPVSDPIGDIFRAMKTLREIDEFHCPQVFVRQWSQQIKDIIDISHESPVYDPRGLEQGGVRYHKLPTVSKIPPTSGEVKDFISLVDRLLEEHKTRIEEERWASKAYIGVHCHYGFNRTGYFIVCYLIERRGYSVQAALDEFARMRPNGIKHAHFTDQLFVRYCVGLEKA